MSRKRTKWDTPRHKHVCWLLLLSVQEIKFPSQCEVRDNLCKMLPPPTQCSGLLLTHLAVHVKSLWVHPRFCACCAPPDIEVKWHTS